MGKLSRSLELSGVGSEVAKLPAGVLDISLELVPKLTQPIRCGEWPVKCGEKSMYRKGTSVSCLGGRNTYKSVNNMHND